MRYVSISILALLLIFQSLGSHVLFHVQRQQIRKEIKHRLKNEIDLAQLHIFKVKGQIYASNMLRWLSEEEFRYKNMFYDVVKTRQVGDDLYLFCVADNQEEILFANLSNLVGDVWCSGEQQNKQEQLSLALSSNYLPAQALELLQSYVTAPFRGFSYAFTISNWESDPAGPPPKRFLI